MSHILEVKIDSKFGLSESIRCTEPDTADCRRWCVEAGCDGYPSSKHEEHALVVVPCGVAEWFNWDTTASIEGYTGETTDLRSGPIVVTMAGEDGFEWHYAEDSHGLETTASAQGIGGRDQGSRTGQDIGHRKTSPHGGTSDSTPSARGPVRPDREECRGCEGPVLLAELTEEDDLPLCNRNWNQWVVRFLNSDDAPSCSAHLIREPHDSGSE